MWFDCSVRLVPKHDSVWINIFRYKLFPKIILAFEKVVGIMVILKFGFDGISWNWNRDHSEKVALAGIGTGTSFTIMNLTELEEYSRSAK